MREEFIANAVDSINNLKENKLPFFISLYDFDYIHSEFWESMHQPTSLRQLIFARITNKKSLRAIIKSKNKDYNKTSTERTHFYGEYKIPFQDESNLSLAKKQLMLLNTL